MAEAVGFEPTNELPRYRISSAGRYDHFDTLPYGLLLLSVAKGGIGTRAYIYMTTSIHFRVAFTSNIFCPFRNLLTHYSIFILILQQILSCISA